MHSAPRALRAEARPFKWNELTKLQQKAVEGIAELLLDALATLDLRKGEPADPIVRDRRSQLAFVDAERGMGKTSVLITVRDLASLGKEATGLPVAVGDLYEKRNRLVWLETLDMEPLSPSANLLAAILARVGEQFEYPSRGTPSRMAAAFDELDDREQTASNLQDLEIDAVLAWRGIDPRRADRIDPTVYAAEVLKSERAGLKLNPRFDRVLNDLAKLVADRGGPQDPMFVLPVDDFDLAPTRCLELLRIIRMVSTARMFFLIVGNARIAETMLRLQCEGDLVKLAGSPVEGADDRSVRLISREIAANNLRKLLPPEQRVRLEKIHVNEALEFRASPTTPPLREALASISFKRNNAPTGNAPTSLKSFLLFDDPLPSDLYSGLSWLAGKPRQIIDRTALFLKHRGELPQWGKPQWNEEFLRDLAEDLARETREDAHLDLSHREILCGLLDTSGALRFNFPGALKMVFETESHKNIGFHGGVLRIRKPGRPRWVFREKGDRSQNSSDDVLAAAIPRSLGGGITILHDLAVSLWGGYLFPYSIHYQPEDFFELVEVVWSTPKGEPSPLQWHPPEWWTLREFERFAAHLQLHVQHCTTADDHVRGWLAGMLEVLMDEPPDVRRGHNPKQIERMLMRLAKEQPTRFARGYLRKSALVAITLVLAPESGGRESLPELLLAPEGALSTALDDDLMERVRSWRAGTFSLVRRQSERREQPIGPEVMRLLSAMSPEAAINVATEQLTDRQRDLPEMDYHWLRNVDSPNAKKRVEELAASLPEPLSTIVLAAGVAGERPYSSHPINRFAEGKLVPSSADLRAIDFQSSRRRYP